jgi:5-methylcytosine-specific restriction protein A
MREAWTKRTANPVKRFGGHALQRLRDQQLSAHPLCEQCEKQGRTRRATIRDHRIPLAEGGTEHPSNIQSLCDDCHDEKTREESMRGRRRAHR